MNVYDGERMAELLADKGHNAEAPEGEEADLVVLNTCHIREKAAEKVYSDIGRLTKSPMADESADDRGGGLRCAGRRRGDHGTRTSRFRWWSARRPITDLPDMLDKAVSRRSARPIPTCPPIAKFDCAPQAAQKSAPSAFLTVQEGCDKFCTYCVVPYTRGCGNLASIQRIWWSKRRNWLKRAPRRSRCWARTSTRGQAKTTKGRTPSASQG